MRMSSPGTAGHIDFENCRCPQPVSSKVPLGRRALPPTAASRPSFNTYCNTEGEGGGVSPFPPPAYIMYGCLVVWLSPTHDAAVDRHPLDQARHTASLISVRGRVEAGRQTEMNFHRSSSRTARLNDNVRQAGRYLPTGLLASSRSPSIPCPLLAALFSCGSERSCSDVQVHFLEAASGGPT